MEMVYEVSDEAEEVEAEEDMISEKKKDTRTILVPVSKILTINMHKKN